MHGRDHAEHHMAVTCIACKLKIRGEKAPVYVKGKNDKGEVDVKEFFLHPECYDAIATSVPIAGTRPTDERLIDTNGTNEEEEPF